MPRRQGIWKNATDNCKVTAVSAYQVNDKVSRVAVEMELPKVNSDLSITYTIYGNGEVLVDYNLIAGGGLPNIPRVGMQMQVTADLDRMEWYGCGPYETYWDRHKGSAVGIYSKSVKKDFYQYVRPQESNNHWGTRWAKLMNGGGQGIAIGAAVPLSFSAWPYTIEDLQTAKHINELPEREIITLNIDHLQMGVGGDDSWSWKARPHEEFRIPPKNYSYSFSIKPASADQGYLLPRF
jgi:beta-galactosidase